MQGRLLLAPEATQILYPKAPAATPRTAAHADTMSGMRMAVALAATEEAQVPPDGGIRVEAIVGVTRSDTDGVVYKVSGTRRARAWVATHGVLRAQVRWAGIGADNDEWFAREDLVADYPDLVAAYEVCGLGGGGGGVMWRRGPAASQPLAVVRSGRRPRVMTTEKTHIRNSMRSSAPFLMGLWAGGHAAQGHRPDARNRRDEGQWHRNRPTSTTRALSHGCVRTVRG